MREAAFIKKNKERWSNFETALKNIKPLVPDELADLYLQVINDLSFSQTYYPKSKTTIYLNDLARKAHFSIYKNKKENSGRIIDFWKYELPFLFRGYQKDLLLSFIIFLVSVAIGFFSVYQNIDFTRIILGDNYVDTTIENIKNGDPAGIYHSSSAIEMFITITLNNIRVGFNAFVSGILTPAVPIALLFYNGVMLGAFDGFFIQHEVGIRANSIIWIHGVFEIFVIVVCGSAGIILGKSVLFPKTFSRLQSIKKGFYDGMKICFSTLPFFICAGFLESFVSRYSTMPLAVAFSIIIVSLCIIVFYYIIYPRQIEKKINQYDSKKEI
ncbi:stage II sporulation protein M [Apibacter sp. HY039]|uniref:stage II sporulation protein M n=1 Tax=Apibacter sp. HY039 TaxID=2501476 RepID=UPI000FEB7E10|nr:stage II sporulation protein M [Apibacter sp. HY039]